MGYLLTVSSDSIPAVWDLQKFVLCRRLIGHEDQTTTGALRNVDELLLAFTGARDHTARLWNALTGDCLVLMNSGAAIIGVAFVDEGSEPVTLCTATQHCLQVWEVGKTSL